MINTVRVALRRTFGALFYSGIAALLWVAAPIVENRFFPVLRDYHFIAQELNADGDLIVSSEFEKMRACTYLGLSWYLGNPFGTFDRVPVYLSGLTGSDTTRPLGKQRSGPWKIDLPTTFTARQHFGLLRYGCGLPWPTLQIIGPFDLPKRGEP